MKTFIKRFLSVIVLTFFFLLSGYGQTPQYYNYWNVGGSSNSFPLNQAAGKMVNWLLLPGEINQPTPLLNGNKITSIYLFISVGGTRTFTDLTIMMAQDTITELTLNMFYSGTMEQVYYRSSVELTATSDQWLKIDLDEPFVYDPSKSLIISMGQCGAIGSGLSVRQNSMPTNRRVWSVGGCPFVPYAGGDMSIVNIGVDVVPSFHIEDSILHQPLCYGDSSGAFSIIPILGTAPYQYSIDSGATWHLDSTFSNLGAGQYYVFATDATGDTVAYYLNPIEIINPPEIVISTPDIINATCYGESDGSIIIHATGGTSFLEYSIDNANSFHLDSIFDSLPAEEYDIIVNDSVGCSVTYSNNPVVINQFPLAESILNEQHCFIFELNDSIYTTSGTYYQYLLNPFGCDSTITIHLTIDTVDLQVSTNFSTLTAHATGATYQWLDCDNSYAVLPGENSQSFTATVDGNYAAMITQGGCTDTTDCYPIVDANILENSFSNSFEIFPNPTSGTFTIQFPANYKNVLLEITDVQGKVIFCQHFSEGTQHTMQLEQPAGVYFITLRSENQKAVCRLIKL